MKLRRHLKLEHGLKQLDLVPLISVVFLLLIFFVLTTNFVTQQGIKVNLPRALTSEAVKQQNLEILVLSDNTLSWDEKIITTPELKNLLKEAAKRNQSVLIKADKRVALGRVVEIWDLCRSTGIAQTNIATNQE